MAKVSKNIDLDTTVVSIKLLIKGNRQMQTINCTYTEVMDFLDFQQRNEAVIKNKHDKEMFENKYFIFDDVIKKKHIQVSLNDIKLMEIPYLFDDGKDYDLKILSYKG
ncbi:hypothetical protein NSA23_00710 [Anaerosalibacter massiliensis]|uniref:Uncharacterized protein n=1 Tax=Anaerosalibacter massiliensis TaxID=1347392 RepID=A0A9X2MGF4_9FIRM|nr:hypothetical protein [Anaerosalibacter massiliensis]MCR2042625.1 hypothetical protein [Anaerosalibacter massiliensis]